MFSHFSVPALLLDDALQPSMPFIDGEVNAPLREFVPLSDDHMLELRDWVVAGGTASVEEHPKQHNRVVLCPGNIYLKNKTLIAKYVFE